ncbi:MAG: MBL fold metallo-hydrolase [Candidatus Eremiobacteraeota bacterium]|nr:MBL fold metallo-hydrolase [Candidatus Eremiobacteraeota bacterium]
MKIQVLDHHFLGAPETVASFLVEGPSGHVLIETGPASTLATIEGALADRGLKPSDIAAVLVTHIHLDHAGASGWWARHGCPIYVHEKGAPHLIDPSKLVASATRIYGDRMQELWGTVEAVPADQVRALSDGQRVEAAGLTFVVHDTPGHARHHMAFQLEDVAFTGDVAAVRLAGGKFISLPAPPPEFDREAWKASLEKLTKLNLSALYLTHFGRFEGVADHLATIDELLDKTVEFFEQNRQLEGEALVQAYRRWDQARATAQGVGSEDYNRYEKANPTFMSVTGVMRYLSKR